MKMDTDVRKMSPKELRREVMRLRTAFRKELDNTGNRRCWINQLKALPEGRTIQPLTLPRNEFLANCASYHARNAPKS